MPPALVKGLASPGGWTNTGQQARLVPSPVCGPAAACGGVLAGQSFYIPYLVRHHHGTARLTLQPPPAVRPAGGYTVLVVDDEEAVRRLAVRMLTWAGYQAIEARHGREALAAIEQHPGPVHLVLTDIKMPGMNGRELGRFVEERWPGKPILYMSGFASEVFRGGLLEPGAPFLAKPFTQDDLAAKVRSLLNGEHGAD
jgi:two-component system, cell cycle sensor histidine kinase and response regulator CckA